MGQDFPRVSSSKSHLSGDDLRAMLYAATELLERNVDSINALNVFPVPDGDTGTNMFLTMRDAMEGFHGLEGATAGDISAAMAREALKAAKGNSGVILSQFFKGMAVGLEGARDCCAEDMVKALGQAKTYSYKAVGEPVEGTMLTVIASAAEAAQRSFGRDAVMSDVFEAASAAAWESVARTPTMLPVLREAGVVDAGGQGLAVILEGVRRSVSGELVRVGEIAPPAPVGLDGPARAVSVEFLAQTEEELYGYCTQFLVKGKALDVEAMRGKMKEVARSTVVVGDETMVKVHAHAEDPGPLVSIGASEGTLSQVRIQNMDEQREVFAAARRAEAAAKQVEVAVVAVAWGRGLEALFASLGAAQVVTGGQTMNPSVRDMLDAVARAPSDNVIILPNNQNVAPAAVQAADLSSKNVRVVDSRSIPQGLAALLSFSQETDLDSNAAEMGEALASVRSAEVTRAVREVTLGGLAVKPGQFIGVLERELVAVAQDVSSVVRSLLRRAEVRGGDLVTLYWGAPLGEDEAKKVAQDVAGSFDGVEFDLVEGGQLHYHFIISID